LTDRGQSVERVGFDEIASVSARVGLTGGELTLSLREGKTRKFNFIEPKIRVTEMGDFIAARLS
jgi:hypothetical protein